GAECHEPNGLRTPGEFVDEPGMGHTPEPCDTVEASCQQGLAVRMDGHAPDQAVLPEHPVQGLAADQVEDPDETFPLLKEDQLAIGMEGQHMDPIRCEERTEGLTGCGIPQSSLYKLACLRCAALNARHKGLNARHKGLAVRVEEGFLDLASQRDRLRAGPPRGRVPEPGRPVGAADQERLAIGADGRFPDGTRREWTEQELTCHRIPEASLALRSIRILPREGRGQHEPPVARTGDVADLGGVGERGAEGMIRGSLPESDDPVLTQGQDGAVARAEPRGLKPLPVCDALASRP